MEIFDILLGLGATPAVWAVFIMGMMVVVYFAIDRHYMKKHHNEEMENINRFHKSEMKMQREQLEFLKEQFKEVNYKYTVINTWAFYADKVLKLNGLKCGNSQGDVMLDWDGVPKPAKPPGASKK